MYSKYAQFLLMSMLLANGGMVSHSKGGQDASFRDDSRLKKSKGLTLYEYSDGFSCWARNVKNADRKHDNYLSQTI